MKELVLYQSGEVGVEEVAPPEELDSLRLRYLPGEGEVLTEEEFVQRGVTIVDLARACYLLLGELLAWKIGTVVGLDETSTRQVVEHYAAQWQVSASSLWKSLVLAKRFPGLELPKDVAPTLTYEIISGCGTKDEAEAVLDLALGEGWTVQEVREIKALRAAGLMDDWRHIELGMDDHNRIVLCTDAAMVPCAARAQTNSGDDGKLGWALLLLRAGLPWKPND